MNRYEGLDYSELELLARSGGNDNHVLASYATGTITMPITSIIVIRTVTTITIPVSYQPTPVPKPIPTVTPKPMN